jgi:CDP-2,3-bis-(O-geranylgeranyl)-sn-glycerol synthase
MIDLTFVLNAFAIILPAYIANSVPVLFAGKHPHPIDFGRNLRDGKRVFGDGKTFEGFFSGLFFGTLTGALVGYALYSFLLALGALLGDMVGAFIKRRLGMPRGKPAPILDQLDFIAGALLLLSIVYPITWEQVVFIVVVTPPIHLFANFVAYRLKLKKHLW